MNALRNKIALTVALGAVIAMPAFASAYPGQTLASQSSVDIVRARIMATKVVPGTIISEELEKESGGTGLRYTFDIKGSHGIREVGIDAITGKTLENSDDSTTREHSATEKGEGPETSGD